MRWYEPYPLHVTRKTAGGDIATLWAPYWLIQVLGMLGIINALLWGGIGIYEAVKFII